MDIPSLSSTVHQYYQQGLGMSTHKSYLAAIQQYVTFCDHDQIEHTPMPTSEFTLLLYMYIAHMGKRVFLTQPLRFTYQPSEVYMWQRGITAISLLSISHAYNKFFMEYKGNKHPSRNQEPDSQSLFKNIDICKASQLLLHSDLGSMLHGFL